MSAHTDAQMMLATQIAYLNIDPKGGPPVNVKNYIENTMRDMESKQSSGIDLGPSEKAQLNTMHNIMDNMANNPDYGDLGWENWTVVDACNDNSGADSSGMYASVIDTGEGGAIIGFRGSESFDNEQKIKDWVDADAALLNNEMTRQQAVAQEYMQRVYDKYGDRYTYDITGHSLGGNLAEHATITAPEGMRDNIGRCVSFDGPGFSDEYIKAHADQIAAMSGKIDHYAWSWVGALLFPVPGTNYIIISAETPFLEHPFIYNLFRHETKNVIFKDGHVIPGVPDPLALKLFGISKIMEIVSPIVVDYVNCQIAVIKGVIEFGMEALHNIEEWINDVIKQMTTVPAEFSIRTDAAYSAADRLYRLDHDVIGIADEVNRLADGLEYDSLSGWYFKSRFHTISRSIEFDAATAVNLGGAIEMCSDMYLRTDSSVASHLTI